jgi:hypothetical protein
LNSDSAQHPLGHHAYIRKAFWRGKRVFLPSVHFNFVEVISVAVVDKDILAGLSTFIVLLLVGTIFRRLHGGGDGALDPLGDRVACGLLAVPLIFLLVRLAFPKEDPGWALAAPLPVLVYTALLAGVDAKLAPIKSHFTKILFGTLVALYLFGAAYFIGAHANGGVTLTVTKTVSGK